jgi:S1-C subfamily serine protease
MMERCFPMFLGTKNQIVLRSLDLNKRRTAIGRILSSIAMVETLPRTGLVGENIVGTAFAVDEKGYVLTAKHVIQGVSAEHLDIRFTRSGPSAQDYGMSQNSVQAIYPHPILDIAVLALSRPVKASRIQLHNKLSTAKVGDSMALIGYALGTELIFCDDISGIGSPKSYTPVAFRGMIAALVPDDGREVDLYVYDCTTFGGNSGAPVIAEDTSEIVAVHLRGFQNHVGYGVPIARFQSFINEVIAMHEPQRKHYREKGRSRR